MKWWLESGVERNRRFPDTFQIPLESERESLRAGDYAKLLFTFKAVKRGCTGEKMWVEITDVAAHAYRGKLRNKPSVIKSLKMDDDVDFLALHVIAIKPREEKKINVPAQGSLFS